MQLLQKNADFLPIFLPQNMSGKISQRIIIKKDYVRKDGTSALYLQIMQTVSGKSKIKRIPLNLFVEQNQFDEKKQIVKKSNPYSRDMNLIIGKKLSELNKILVNFRLSDRVPTVDKVAEELQNPSLRFNFNNFASEYLERQKNLIKHSTYRQQKGALSKIKRFRDPLFFSDIDQELLRAFRAHFKGIGNQRATIESTVKNFKKFLHAANTHGIRTPLNYTDISVKKMVGQRTFLLPHELKKTFDYYNSPFINDSHKKILKRYLFSCFTGIRLSDSEKITEANFVGDYLAFTMYKTEKFIRIKLNKTALSLVNLPEVFNDNFSREYINRELKVIAKVLGIKKRVYFHSSRHTFATNFILLGGDIVNLKNLLGHSKLDETMIYVHIVESITNSQVELLDDIVR